MRECKAFVEKNDIQIIGTYIDRALSAKTDNRPDFQRMIKESSSGMFNIVIVWKLDRFARNRYDSAHCKSIFRKNGVKVVFPTVQKAFCSNLCLKVWRNITLQSCPKRL